jgi:hypothetical protein
MLCPHAHFIVSICSALRAVVSQSSLSNGIVLSTIWDKNTEDSKHKENGISKYGMG